MLQVEGSALPPEAPPCSAANGIVAVTHAGCLGSGYERGLVRVQIRARKYAVGVESTGGARLEQSGGS